MGESAFLAALPLADKGGLDFSEPFIEKKHALFFSRIATNFGSLSQTASPLSIPLSPSTLSPSSQQLSPFYCSLCKKKFSNEKTLFTHEQSKSHLKLLSQATKKNHTKVAENGLQKAKIYLENASKPPSPSVINEVYRCVKMKGSEGGVREGYEGCVVLKEVLQTAFLFEIDGSETRELNRIRQKILFCRVCVTQARFVLNFFPEKSLSFCLEALFLMAPQEAFFELNERQTQNFANKVFSFLLLPPPPITCQKHGILNFHNNVINTNTNNFISTNHCEDCEWCGGVLVGRSKEIISLATLLFEISLFFYFSHPTSLSDCLSSFSSPSSLGNGRRRQKVFGREVGERLLEVSQVFFALCGEEKMFKSASLFHFRLLFGTKTPWESINFLSTASTLSALSLSPSLSLRLFSFALLISLLLQDKAQLSSLVSSSSPRFSPNPLHLQINEKVWEEGRERGEKQRDGSEKYLFDFEFAMAHQLVELSIAVLQGDVGTLILAQHDLHGRRGARGGKEEWKLREVGEWDPLEEGWGGWEEALLFALSLLLD